MYLPTVLPGILPPSRTTWEAVLTGFKYFPIFNIVQLLTSWYPMGKTSYSSRFNLPGKIAWVTMESPTFLVITYIVNTLPQQQGIAQGFWGLPGTNKLMIALYVLHYLNRAVLTPIFLQPSIAPIHILVWLFAFTFNTCNAIQIGGWLGGYGITNNMDWAGGRARIQIGLMIFCLGLFSNILHDDELREVRRRAKREEEEKAKKGEKTKDGETSERVYKIPQSLGFRFVLYPHYLSEWIEWAGYWMIGGSRFIPGRNFLFAELASMLPRAMHGKQWYIQKFGKENVGNKKAVIPFFGP